MRGLRTLLLLALGAALAACQTQNFEMTKEPRRNGGGSSRVLLMPSNIELGELTAGGVVEPRADWTEEASRYLAAALRDEEAAQHVQLLDFDEGTIPADRRDELHQITKLYGTVAQAIFTHQYSGPLQLPTKSKGFDWSLGPSLRSLREQTGADYALLTYVRDSYASGGRQALMVLGAIAGIGVSGGVQVAFVSLVDLQTGNVVWFNRLIRGTGDLRSADGAHEVAKVLLASEPK